VAIGLANDFLTSTRRLAAASVVAEPSVIEGRERSPRLL
jgi:hypothetical protein